MNYERYIKVVERAKRFYRHDGKIDHSLINAIRLAQKKYLFGE